MFQVGQVIGGRFRVDSLLGAGGMGVVAAATHLELGHRVAIKVLREELAANTTTVERFLREARAVVNLRTEHVCRVIDVGRLDSGAPYIVMEMLEGADLQRAIAKRPLPVSTAVDYVLQACVALAEAHAAGIIHRDLKPANLFVTRRLDGGPLVKVLDFGIAKAMAEQGPQLTHADGIMGSPGYMSPEQLQSARDVDLRTDIWALGVTLYQLVSARMPFAGTTLTEIAIKVATEPPAPLDIGLDHALAAVIMRCLEKNPADRYPSVSALAAELVRFSTSDGRRAAAIAAQLGGGPAMQMAPPPPMVSAHAPTAASTAGSYAGQVGALSAVVAPASTVPAARKRWPLIVGGLLLVGATVGITLAVGSGRSSSTASPVTPMDPAPTTPAGSGEVAVAPATSGDPWATQPEPVAPEPVAIDAAVTPDAAPAPTLEEAYGGLSPEFTKQVADARAQAKKGCQAMIANKQLAAMPAALPQLVMCHCILGDKPSALKAFARISEQNQRQAVLQVCKFNGASLE